MARVYLETSFVSACITSRDDAASIYRRETSTEWMRTQSAGHEMFISAEVLEELDNPAFPRREEAIALASGFPLLDIDTDVLGLAAVLVSERVMPGPVKGDALHVAAATVHRIDYMLSWNVRHLANPNKVAHLTAVCVRAGRIPPRIITPELLWEKGP